jgi:hypothetical protein
LRDSTQVDSGDEMMIEHESIRMAWWEIRKYSFYRYLIEWIKNEIAKLSQHYFSI